MTFALRAARELIVPGRTQLATFLQQLEILRGWGWKEV
jgi:hypothetical protein